MILEREKLIQQLRDIQRHQYLLEEENDATYFLNSLLYYIGDPDAELRDELIYETFEHWICVQRYFEEDELEKLLMDLASEAYLLKGIDKLYKQDAKQYHTTKASEADELTLTRAFSALVIAAILSRHLDEPFLKQVSIEHVADQLLYAFESEHDFRGYEMTLGWFHAIAHYADVLTLLLKCEGVSEAYLKSFMKAISKLYARADRVLGAQEEERLINALYDPVFVSGILEVEDIRTWLFDMGSMDYLGLDSELNGYNETARRTNKKLMLRALYFRGMKRSLDEAILDLIYWLEYDLVKFK